MEHIDKKKEKTIPPQKGIEKKNFRLVYGQ